jgi:hypothetical protein
MAAARHFLWKIACSETGLSRSRILRNVPYASSHGLDCNLPSRIGELRITILLYELRVRERDRVFQARALAWEELAPTLNRLRAEHGLGVDFELFYKGRCVLTEQQIECFF